MYRQIGINQGRVVIQLNPRIQDTQAVLNLADQSIVIQNQEAKVKADQNPKVLYENLDQGVAVKDLCVRGVVVRTLRILEVVARDLYILEAQVKDLCVPEAEVINQEKAEIAPSHLTGNFKQDRISFSIITER